jgi:hypothetical protein
MNAPTRQRMISDDQVDAALEWLRANASVIGKAKQRADLAEKYVGHVEALLMKASNATSADARKADARASDKYLEAITDAAVAAGELAKLYSLREAASARIECWRTEQSTFRAMRI